MDIRRYTDRLPGCFHDWSTPSVRPVSQRYGEVLGRVRGLTTANILQTLNLAVNCLEDNEVYCEVGCFQGATLIGALLEHPACTAYAVDNFSEFDGEGRNQRILSENLAAFGLRDRVHFHNQDFETFLLDHRPFDMKIGAYLYDAAHDYRSTLMGLLLVAPLLADRALIFLDDSNGASVKQAAWDFMAARHECRLLFDLPTSRNGEPTFWNGLLILAWEFGQRNGYAPAVYRAARQPALLEAIYALRQRG
jgi:protein O-GlcNAc transferase